MGPRKVTMVGERWSMLSRGGFIDLGQSLKAGVYLLTYRGEVVYVGQSRELLRRIYEHRMNYLRFKTKRKPHPVAQAKAILFDGVMVLPCNPHDLDRLERQYIQLHQPKLNTRLKAKKFEGSTSELLSMLGLETKVTAPAPGPELKRRA